MEAEILSNAYELAYHLNPDIDESEVKTCAQAVENLISQTGGAVLNSREAKRQHLSFPIKQKKYSYFGVIDFSGAPEIIEKINASIKLQNTVLRYLVVRKDIPTGELKVLGSERPRPRMKTHEPSAVSRESAKPKEEIKPEVMEQ